MTARVQIRPEALEEMESSRSRTLGGARPTSPRRALATRFPSAVFFDVRGEEVDVLAVAHTRRKPGYWRRLSPRNPGDQG